MRSIRNPRIIRQPRCPSAGRLLERCIRQHAANKACRWSEVMEAGCLAATQMENLYAEGGQDISDQATVAAPPEKFCAHEDSA